MKDHDDIPVAWCTACQQPFDPPQLFGVAPDAGQDLRHTCRACRPATRRSEFTEISNVRGPNNQFIQVLWIKGGGLEVRTRDELTERRVQQVLAELGETPLL